MQRLFSLLLLCVVFAAALMAAGKVLTDDEIYDQVRIKLTADREIGGSAIDVKVNQGNVELHGTVKKDQYRGKAERIAKKVKGVKSVANHLQVAAGPGGATPPGTNQ